MANKQYQFKLVLLGESAVGKSSLVLRFVKDQFDDYRESTIGAAFLTQTVTLEDQTAVKFEIWDTAGQERYKSLAPMYYRNANCAVVVYDITQTTSLDKARTWIRELQRQADPSIVIALCGNKLDLAARRQVTQDEAKKYAEEEGLMWMETSAKTGEGVADVFTAIAKKLPLTSPSARTGTGRSAAGSRTGVDLNKQASSQGQNEPFEATIVLGAPFDTQQSGCSVTYAKCNLQAGCTCYVTETIMVPWNGAKAKVQLRLSVQRLRTLQQKKEAQAKAARREIATLVERSKTETARIKVEALINEDIYAELLELLELYCELLIARFGLLEQSTREPGPGISEGVCSIIHAAPRTELKELHVLREILMHKYGREFSLAAMENQNGCVSERVIRKLVIQTPSPELVDAYTAEIAKGYGIETTPPNADTIQREDIDTTKEHTAFAEKGPANEEAHVAESPNMNRQAPGLPKEDGFEALLKRFNALKQR
ncbi:hypothetical protein APHAL10511_005962 [Amanita phalloides]|nr:hypothetical protein APHAL10511_005962 [Amanita phalloides]